MSVYSDLKSIIKLKTHRELDVIDSVLSHLLTIDTRLRVTNTFRRLCKIVNHATDLDLVNSSHIDYDEENSSLYLTLYGVNVNPVTIGCIPENDRVIIEVGDIKLIHFDLSENQLDTLVSRMVFDNRLSDWGMLILKAINSYETSDMVGLELSPALGDKMEQHLNELDGEVLQYGEDKKDYTPVSSYTEATTTFVYDSQTTNQDKTHQTQPETQVEEHKSDTKVDKHETNVESIDELKRGKLREVYDIVSGVMSEDPVVKLCEEAGYAGLARLEGDAFNEWKTTVDYTPRNFQEFIAESYINYVGGFTRLGDIHDHESAIVEFTNNLIQKLVSVHWDAGVMTREVVIESLLNSKDWGSNDLTLSLIMDAFNIRLDESPTLPVQLAEEIRAVVSKTDTNIRQDINALNLFELIENDSAYCIDEDKALFVSKQENDNLITVLFLRPDRIVFTAIRYMDNGYVDRYGTVTRNDQHSIYYFCKLGLSSHNNQTDD